jgi:hypothetical protein
MNRRYLPSTAKATCGGGFGLSVNGLTSAILMQKSHSLQTGEGGAASALVQSPADTRAALHTDYRKLWFPNPNPHVTAVRD